VRDGILALHIATGSFGLILGPITMLAPKRRGRHTRAGTVYHFNMLAVCVSAAAMAIIDFRRIWWFLPIAAFSYANAFVGWRAVRRRRPGWLPTHIAGMGGSYIALTTAVLVVNLGVGAWYAWALPTLVGTPLIRIAVARHRRSPAAASVVNRSFDGSSSAPRRPWNQPLPCLCHRHRLRRRPAPRPPMHPSPCPRMSDSRH